MNNKAVIGIIAAVVVLGAIFFATRGNNSSDVASDSSSADSASGASMENTTIKSLIAGEGSRKCTFKTTEAGVESSGTVYAGGGKMRGDFTSTIEGKETMSHMIYDGTTSYIWMDGQATGFKMALDAEQTASAEQNQSVDVNKNYEFDCDSWSVDNSKFEVPGNVEFSDFSAMAGAAASANAAAGTAGSTDTKALQQAACNNLPEAAKAQCLAAIQ